uniref:Ribonuclease P protein component 1 n=1 Tax=Thermofilum pendens TaxID=2269 RepID=A0A7J3X7T0_THEPE
MRITPRNILNHELIGLEAEVVDSANKCLVGAKGLILDETRNTLLLGEPGGTKKRVLKHIAVLRIKLPDGTTVRVDGRVLVGAPEDRLKKHFYRW